MRRLVLLATLVIATAAADAHAAKRRALLIAINDYSNVDEDLAELFKAAQVKPKID